MNSERKFIDRQTDLATLQQQYERKDASLVVVYGRRRIGKTALLTHFMKDLPAVYFLATEESEKQNLNAFKQEASDFLHDDLLASSQLDRWEPVFQRLAEFADKNDRRLLIILDEFQYIGKANSAFPSVFQKIWDTILCKTNVMVVLCGSLISLIVSQTLSESSPLYGRRTAQIRMKQISFSYYGDFFDSRLSKRELVERYAVTGGVPKYIESFEGKGGLYNLIENTVLNPNSYLFDEPNFLLSKEVSEIGSYFSLMKAIAAGNHKLADISSRLGVASTGLTKYLKVLEDLDLVCREVPVTESNPERSKKGLYFMKDNFMRFWFRFVFPYRGLLETGRTEMVLKNIKERLTDNLASYVYEDICREQIWELADEGVLSFLPERVGRWWGSKDVEIDIVALSSAEDSILFGECEFWKTPVGVNIFYDLEQKAKQVKWGSSSRNEMFALFSISGYTDDLKAFAATRPDVLLL